MSETGFTDAVQQQPAMAGAAEEVVLDAAGATGHEAAQPAAQSQAPARSVAVEACAGAGNACSASAQ